MTVDHSRPGDGRTVDDAGPDWTNTVIGIAATAATTAAA
jgi:hypothetical protein